MQKFKQLLILMALTSNAWGDLSCPNETEPVCIDMGDKVCPGSTICVDEKATCFDAFPCDPNDGFVCASEYDADMNDCRQVVTQHDALAEENVDLRVQRLEVKNCVLNASGLDEAKGCVR